MAYVSFGLVKAVRAKLAGNELRLFCVATTSLKVFQYIISTRRPDSTSH